MQKYELLKKNAMKWVPTKGFGVREVAQKLKILGQLIIKM